jgi:hypothetical protein
LLYLDSDPSRFEYWSKQAQQAAHAMQKAQRSPDSARVQLEAATVLSRQLVEWNVRDEPSL